jgi:GntR family transcriptional regulator, transcriptional repressor for pyruvate dehydrogenase complex
MTAVSNHFKSLTISSAPEALAGQILKMVEAGELQPGMRLPPQRELARMFGVGLGSVREAVKMLTATGYLSVVRGKGTFIAENALDRGKAASELEKRLKAVSLADLMKAREIVECGAARFAAMASDPGHLVRLTDIVGAMDRNRDRAMDFNRADFTFHLALAEASNNTAVFEMVKLLVDKAHDHVDFMDNFLKTFEPEQVARAIETARDIIHHIRNGNPEDAGRSMIAHLNIVNFELKKELPG